MGGLEFLLMGSTALGVGGSLFKSFRAADVGKLQAHIAKQNTNLLLKSADLQDDVKSFLAARNNFEITRVRDAVRKVAGAQVTHWAANNLDPTVGSPMLIAMQTAAQGEADVGLVRAQGFLEAAEIDAKKARILGDASTSAWQEAAVRERAFSDRMAGYFGAAGTLLNATRQWAALGTNAADDPWAGARESDVTSYMAGGLA
jgi:hypothetical protein